MLGLSSKTAYAVAALFELDQKSPEEATKIKEIATAANIPQNFLEQILLALKKAGVLTSTKGAHGGYKLSKPLTEITLTEITLAEIIGILEDGYFDERCKTDNDALKLFWNDIRKHALEAFDIPLSELRRYRNQVNQTLDYTI